MRFSKLFFPLFAVGYAIAIVAATATYSQDARADFALNVVGCSSFSLSGNVLTCVPTTSSGSGTCTIGVTSSPTTSAGGNVGLSANCSTTFATYGWTRNGATLNSTTNTASDSLPANTTSAAISYSYGLTACNGSTCAPTTSVSLIVPAVGGTTGGGGTPVSCSGFTKTVNIDLPWAGTAGLPRVLTGNYGGFGANDAMVIQLHPPAGRTSSANGTVTLVEWGGGPIPRLSVISTTPCDFSTANVATLYNASKGADPKFFLQVGGKQTVGVVLLQPGQTYYLNVKNSGCPTGSQCNMNVDFAPSPGTY
jgi:hypothetical protein